MCLSVQRFDDCAVTRLPTGGHPSGISGRAEAAHKDLRSGLPPIPELVATREMLPLRFHSHNFPRGSHRAASGLFQIRFSMREITDALLRSGACALTLKGDRVTLIQRFAVSPSV